MDLKYKLVIAGIVDAFVLDYIVFPSLTMASTAQNLIGLFTIGSLAWLNYLFFTQTENKFNK